MNHLQPKGPPRWFLVGLAGGVSGIGLVLLGALLGSSFVFWTGLMIFVATIVFLSAPAILIFLGLGSLWLTLKSIQMHNWLEYEI